MVAKGRFAPAVDPIELEIIQEAMISIVREMRVNLVATAYSSIICEAYDFSCVLIDGKGQIVALAEDNPSHIFPVPWSVRQMFDTFGEDIRPGDVFFHNDPYTGGTHLNDIAMMFPVFADGRLVLFPPVRAHWGDVGGTTPGSISGKSTEIFHDGVRLPIVKIASGGEFNQGPFDVMTANMRVPRERRGDFTGSSSQTRAAMNAGPAVAATGAFIVLKAFLDPLDRINHGNFRPITITTPEGSFFNAWYPASCAGSSEVRHAAISAALGAMSQAMPERMAGDVKGTSNHIYIGGRAGNPGCRLPPDPFRRFGAPRLRGRAGYRSRRGSKNSWTTGRTRP